MNDDKERIEAVRQKSRDLIASLGELASFINFTEDLSPSMKRTLNEKIDKSLAHLAELMRISDDQGYQRWKALQDLLSKNMGEWDD